MQAEKKEERKLIHHAKEINRHKDRKMEAERARLLFFSLFSFAFLWCLLAVQLSPFSRDTAAKHPLSRMPVQTAGTVYTHLTFLTCTAQVRQEGCRMQIFFFETRHTGN
mmetsp:Transcript_47162/g.93042  ORF Transcript_47162/g.93042 Transcript_47162/m.93042 type:complete len:109 (+) Transcript_47162:1525-1851(+)